VLPEQPPAYCPVCNGYNISLWSQATDVEYFSVPGTYDYFQCKDCQTIFIHPVPVEQLKQIYPANYYSFVSHRKNLVTGFKEWLDKLFFKKILKTIPGEQLSVLDAGGGTGWLLDRIKETDPRVSFTQVVDIDEHAKGIAERNGHAYAQSTIEDFSTEKKFDLVLLLNLIEHVADPLTVLNKCASILNEKGVIVIKTPNTQSLDAKLFRKTYWGGLHCPRHWIIFSEKSFRLLLASTSLQVKKLQYTQGAPFWAFSVIAVLHRKKIIKVSAQKPIIFHWLFAPVSALFAAFDFIRRPFAKTSQMFILLEKK
jgi:2-polyprenyl-3-methyl-5-hydroxy-6-metoxy-1,4-benzoquinol methylase